LECYDDIEKEDEIIGLFSYYRAREPAVIKRQNDKP